MVRELIDRGCRVAIATAQRTQEFRASQQTGVTVHLRVAYVTRDGIVTMSLLDVDEACGNFIDRFAPRDLLPAVCRSSYRSAQAVGVLMHVFEREGLGADVPATEGVTLIAANGQDFFVANADLDAAHRLAQVTGTVVGALFGADYRAHGSVFLTIFPFLTMTRRLRSGSSSSRRFSRGSPSTISRSAQAPVSRTPRAAPP